MRRKTIQILFLTICCALNVFAQENGESLQKEGSKTPIKIDEFGLITECDLSSRLDSFFVSLNEKPSMSGYIIFYQGKDVLPAGYESNQMQKVVRNHLRFRNFDSSRVIFLTGGFREQAATELYLVPNNAAAPEPTNTVAAPTMPTNKTFIYDRKSFVAEYSYDSSEEFILPSVKAKIEEENRLAEEESKIAEPLSKTEVEEIDRWNEEAEKRRLEALEQDKFSWVNEEFGEIIKSRKDSSGVIIFYADDTYYDINKFQRRIEEGRQKIVEANKLPTKKIQVIYGGYRNEIQVEFWVVPKKGKSPTPTPEERIIEEVKN